MNRAEYEEAVSKCPNHPHEDGPFRYCSVKGCPWTEQGPLDGFDDDPTPQPAAAGVRRDLIRSVIAQQEQEWDSEGDAWLFHPNPDEAYLLVDALADAIEAALGQDGTEGDSDGT